MKTKFNNYGRRILKTKNNKSGKIEYRLSGQWVGHKHYGDQYGTKQQRLNASQGNTILGISDQILWNVKGRAGDLITNLNLKKYTFSIK